MNPVTSWIGRALGPYSKTVAALVGYSITIVVQQETLPHPFTGNWWIALLTGFGGILGIFGVPNTITAVTSNNNPAPAPAPVPAVPPAA